MERSIEVFVYCKHFLSAEGGVEIFLVMVVVGQMPPSLYPYLLIPKFPYASFSGVKRVYVFHNFIHLF